MFTPFFDDVAKQLLADSKGKINLRIISVDLPSHGGSPKPFYTKFEDFSERFLAFLNVLECPNLLLVGHSLGGMIALHLASQIHKNGPVKNHSTAIGLCLMAVARNLWVNPDFLKLAEDDPKAAVDFVKKWGFLDDDFSDPDSPKARALKVMLAEADIKFAQSLRACMAWGDQGATDIQLLPKDFPILFQLSNDDVMTRVEGGLELASLHPNSKVKLIKGASHMIPVEQPKDSAHHLFDFIKDHYI